MKKFWQNNVFIFLALFFVVLVLYWPSLHIGFLSDDWHALFIANEPGGIWHYFATNIIGTRQGSSYGPVWNFLMETEYCFFHLHAIWYHAVSILLFSSTSFVIYLFCKSLKASRVAAAVAALFWLFLPSHVEPVAWISGQPHLLSAFFYILCLYLYLLSLKNENKYNYYVLSLASLFISLFSKEIGITAVAGCGLMHIFFADKKIGARKYFSRLFLRLLLPALIAVVYLFLRKFTTGVLAGYYGASAVAIDPYAMIRMLVEMTINIIFSYPERLRVLAAVSSHLPLFGFGAVVIIGALKFYSKKNTFFIFSISMYFVSILPYLALGYSALGDEGERYTYLPTIFAAMFVAAIWPDFAGLKNSYFLKTVLIAGAAVIFLFSSVAVRSKLTNWELAGQIVQRNLSNFPLEEVSSARRIIFVGLPDDIMGAQLFRNGINEAIYLLHKKNLRATERVPMWSLLLPDSVDKLSINFESNENGSAIWSAGGSRIFIGLPKYETVEGVWSLTDFRAGDQTGRTIVFAPSAKFLADTLFIYWSNGDFKVVALK